MNSSLSKYILTTLVYYDVMDYPMTAFEVWKYLTCIKGKDGEDEKFSFSEILDELENGNVGKFTENFRGFYFLKGRKNLVEERIKRNKISFEKLKIARKMVTWLRYIPFVRMIAVTGRLAMKNAQEKSDVDFLIVLKKGRMFTGRTLVTLALHLIGKRRYGRKISDRACLNYFISSRSLEIIIKDLFSASEYMFMFPLFGFETYQKFQLRNNWISEYKKNYRLEELAPSLLVKDNFWSERIRIWGEKILNFDFLERWLRDWQVRRIKKDPRTKNPGSMVVADEEMLIFLPHPQGPVVFEKFQKKLEEVSKSTLD